MPKHIYYHSENFSELMLSVALRTFFREELETHLLETENQSLKFIQGRNVIEDNHQAILKFANHLSKNKFFGKNSVQESVIQMINGVCKDIMLNLGNQEKFNEKVDFLNKFWNKSSSDWLKKNFYSCHVNIFMISFFIQQVKPQILIAYPVFVQIRKLIIIQFENVRFALQEFFINCKYSDYDIFPENQEQKEIRQSMRQSFTDFVELQTNGKRKNSIHDTQNKKVKNSGNQEQMIEQRIYDQEAHRQHSVGIDETGVLSQNKARANHSDINDQTDKNETELNKQSFMKKQKQLQITFSRPDQINQQTVQNSALDQSFSRNKLKESFKDLSHFAQPLQFSSKSLSGQQPSDHLSKQKSAPSQPLDDGEIIQEAESEKYVFY